MQSFFRLAVLSLIFFALRMFNTRRSKNQKPPCQTKKLFA